ncbi:MAG: LPS-assembly protein LptD [Treponema sp.]|jgi:hypothetical protein|nr:LPS-assembly protein LptD [Treponema sp.]
MKKRLKIFFFYFLFSFSLLVYAQENDEYSEEETETVDEELSIDEQEPLIRISHSERRRIEMEIITSSLEELAIWSRFLGLSESGTRADLSGRILEHFNLPEIEEQSEENRRVITIESAQTTEYFTIDAVNEDYARLRGGVSISLRDGEDTHKITAQEILFNRTRNIITARGGVVYEKVDTASTETFRGENITVNIDNWSSIFLDGSSTIDSDGTAYLFSGQVISRTEDDVTILRRARISSAGKEEALWSISASRLWLLPGSDFAIFNALLKVGEIPVLYIPFFFFPTDEIVFHPVIGYRTREGGFLQTTTYILGRPKASDAEQSSLSKIFGNSDDMEKERHGIFLRSTGKKAVDTTEVSLKAMIDYYVNLGTFLGIDLAVPKTSALDSIDFSLGIGFTRTISPTSFGFSPYAPDYDGSFDWNKSDLFSFQVPFRYRMRFTSGISGKLGSLRWSFPIHSDPFVDSDFINNRAESMDWVNMVQQGGAFDTDSSTPSEIGAYQWQVSGNLNPSITAFAPYISRMSISSISMTMGFRTIQDNTVNPFSPNRSFFAPDKFTLYSITGQVSGNPLSITGNRSPSTPAAATNIEIPELSRGLTPISPWTNEETTTDETPTSDTLTPPVLRQTFPLPRVGNTTFTIDYSISPTSSTELQFMNAGWRTSEDIDWGEVQSILTSVSGTTTLNFHMNHTTGFFSNHIALTGTGHWRDFTFLNEDAFLNDQGEVDESRMEQARRHQYSQTNYSSSYAYTGRIQPLTNNAVFRQTNVGYNFRGTLVRSRRFTDGDGPELRPNWGSWVKDERTGDIDNPGLTAHTLSANLAASVMDKNQNITFTTNLPPLDERITTNAGFNFWIVSITMNTSMDRMTMTTANINAFPKKQEGDWIFRPINYNQTLRFQNVGSLTFNTTVDPEKDFDITTIRSTLTLWDLRVSFFATEIQKSVFVFNNPNAFHEGGRWEFQGERELNPRELSFSYSKQFGNFDIIKNRMNMSFNLRSSLIFDLQRHTNSNFEFSYGLTQNIPGFLTLSLTASSTNSVIMRYFKNVPGMGKYTQMYSDGPQNNLFRDLLDSFNFFDEEKRRRTGFKMQRLNFSATHLLGDWTAIISVSMYPYQRPVANIADTQINFTSDFSLIVQWTPISEFKSHVKYDGREDKWTRGQ